MISDSGFNIATNSEIVVENAGKALPSSKL